MQDHRGWKALSGPSSPTTHPLITPKTHPKVPHPHAVIRCVFNRDFVLSTLDFCKCSASERQSPPVPSTALIPSSTSAVPVNPTSHFQAEECLGPYLCSEKHSPGWKGKVPAGPCSTEGLSQWSPPQCLPSEISFLKANSPGHIAGINCTPPVLQSRAKMHLCNPKLVLLGKMFHQINCRRKGSVINYACLSSLSYARSAFADKDEDTLYSFKNGVPCEGINWISRELAAAIYFSMHSLLSFQHSL